LPEPLGIQICPVSVSRMLMRLYRVMGQETSTASFHASDQPWINSPQVPGTIVVAIGLADCMGSFLSNKKPTIRRVINEAMNSTDLGALIRVGW
jgi:hypothetical protein